MNYVRLGRTGVLVSEVALGTMTFGNESDETVSRALMDRALELGINFFDTATNYNKGRTEEIVGRWIGPHRQEIILASKVYFPTGGGRNDEGLSARNLRFAVERSLKRLQTDYLDILYLHHWDEHTEIEQTLAAVDALVAQGKVLYLGVSNFAAWQTMKAIAVSREHDYPPIVITQPMYSLVKRQVEVEILPLAEHERLAVAPYNAMGAGLLSGKYLTGEAIRARLNEVEMYKQRYANPVYAEVTKRFVDFAKQANKPPAALAVAWVMSNPLVTSAIVGARGLEQFNETMGCLDIRLTPEDRAEITALSVDPPTATDRESMAAMRARGW